jgi:polyhydroxyalkanoate synthesis regulator phasin
LFKGKWKKPGDAGRLVFYAGETRQCGKGERKMIDLVKKMVFASIGMVLKTKDEVEEMARDFAKKAELSENEGKKFVNDFMKRYDESREKLEEKVEKTVKEVLGRSSLATKDELTEIKEEIKKLKKNNVAE